MLHGAQRAFAEGGVHGEHERGVAEHRGPGRRRSASRLRTVGGPEDEGHGRGHAQAGQYTATAGRFRLGMKPGMRVRVRVRVRIRVLVVVRGWIRCG